MSSKFSSFNEKLFRSKEISSIGTVGTVRLLKGKIVKLLNYIGRSIAYSSTRSFGSFILSFGLMSLFLHLGEYYFADEPEIALSLAVGAACAVLAVPLLVVNKPMCLALQDFALTDYILFEFLLIKRMHSDTDHSAVVPLVAAFLGFIPAIIGFFVPIYFVVLGIIIAVFVTLALIAPEFPMILTLLILPYLELLPLSRIVLISLSFITFISFAIKVLIGKRVYNFDIYDAIIAIIILLVMISGALGQGPDSLKNSIIFTVLLLGYFPASDLIVNRRLADCAMNAVIVSAIPIAAVSAVEFAVELRAVDFTSKYSTPGISAFFSSPSSLAAFMIVAAILTLAFALQKKNRAKKTFYFSVFVFEAFLLGLMLQPGVLVAVALVSVAYLIFTSNKIPHDVIAVLIVAAHLLLLIPIEKLNAVSKYFGFDLALPALVSGYKRALKVFTENIWFGAGIGDGSYKAASGMNSSGIFNTLLGIGVEIGVFALVLFAIMILIRLRHLSYYRHYTKKSFVNTAVNMTALVTVALLIYGSFADIFENAAVFYLFWTVFGICTSSLRTARKEYDDRLGYYGDLRSAESSAIDISIIE